MFHCLDHTLNLTVALIYMYYEYFLERAEGGNISPQLFIQLQIARWHSPYTILLIEKTIKYWLLDTSPAVAGLTQNKLYSCSDPRNPVICPDHWFWRSLGSRAANEGSRIFHNDGEGPPLHWDLLSVKDHDWQSSLRIYANRTAQSLWPLHWRPNFMFMWINDLA